MKSKRFLLYITSIFSLILIYTIISYSYNDSMFMPTPNLIFDALSNIFKSSRSYQILFTFIIRLFISCVIGFFIGFILALFSFRYKSFYYFLKPYMTLFRSTPIVSISLILFFLFKSSFSLYFIVFLVNVPLVYEGIYKSYLGLDKSLVDTTRIYLGFRLKYIFKTLTPVNFLYLKTSFIQIIGFTAKVLVTAEFITSASFSLGAEIMLYSQFMMYDYVYAWTLILIVIVFITDIFIK